MALTLATGALAQQRTFDIPAQDAVTAIGQFGLQAGLQITAPTDELKGVKTDALRGAMDARAALQVLLKGTGLVVARDDGRTIVLAQRPQGDGVASGPDEAAQVDAVLVTGSRIRGAPPSSPVISITAEDIRNSGQSNLGEVARSIPQSFGGGQNPTIATGAPGGSLNVNSASSLNLRGLGPDATLTLLNGHRLSYTSAAQAIDISSIPTAAVSRLEVVVDGASALYGSDAVAGVANVILRRDFEGLTTSVGYGRSTDGGNERKTFSAVGGRVWDTGGFLVALDREDLSGITADKRSYASALYPTTMLTPDIESTLAVFSGHQQLTSRLTVEVDALVGRRESLLIQPLLTTQDYLVQGQKLDPRTTSFTIAPKLNYEFSDGWTASLSGVFGRDKTTLNTLNYANSQESARYPGLYNNSVAVVEGSAEGPIFQTPAGAARLAVGAGYRRNELEAYLAFLFTTGAQTISRDYKVSNESSYGYGELYVPLVNANDADAIVQRSAITTAVRWEDYGGSIGQVATPKIGASVETKWGVSFKGSWGKSFKAPTLDQLYQPSTPSIYSPTFFASTTYPASAQVLHLSGGNSGLDPEKAQTWTATVGLSPTWLTGSHFEISYFDVNYRGRVVAPITTSRALENPLYVNFITQRPSVAQVTAALAQATGALRNNTSSAYDPSRVVAIVDARLQNANQQKARGVDMSGRYTISVAQADTLTLTGSASYLESTQRLEAGSVPIDLAGTIGRPPHWRGRLGGVWESGPFTVASYVTHVGGVVDNRLATFAQVRPMTTVDFTSRYAFSGGRLADGLTIGANVLNVLNEKPARIRTTAAYYPPYDSNSYSPVGRYIGVYVEKRW
jgi:outer membrane receptor protein involved in Fe transport